MFGNHEHFFKRVPLKFCLEFNKLARPNVFQMGIFLNHLDHLSIKQALPQVSEQRSGGMNNFLGRNFIFGSSGRLSTLHSELNAKQGEGITDSDPQPSRFLIRFRFTRGSLDIRKLGKPILQRSEDIEDQTLIKVERERQIGRRDPGFVLFGHRSPPARGVGPILHDLAPSRALP